LRPNLEPEERSSSLDRSVTAERPDLRDPSRRPLPWPADESSPPPPPPLTVDPEATREARPGAASVQGIRRRPLGVRDPPRCRLSPGVTGVAAGTLSPSRPFRRWPVSTLRPGRRRALTLRRTRPTRSVELRRAPSGSPWPWP
jgi:hypothetical protein